MKSDWYVVIGCCLFAIGVTTGLYVEGFKWRSDCDNLGAHLSNTQVYDCKPRKP